jgi:hypothetical protein
MCYKELNNAGRVFWRSDLQAGEEKLKTAIKNAEFMSVKPFCVKLLMQWHFLSNCLP